MRACVLESEGIFLPVLKTFGALNQSKDILSLNRTNHSTRQSALPYRNHLHTRVRERIPGANSFLKGGRSGFHFGASVAALRDSSKMKKDEKRFEIWLGWAQEHFNMMNKTSLNLNASTSETEANPGAPAELEAHPSPLFSKGHATLKVSLDPPRERT